MRTQGQVGQAKAAPIVSDATEEFVTFTISGQLFGIPVLKVQDVLSSYQITRIPMAPPEIMGSLNLRGRVVPATLGRPRDAHVEPGLGVAGHEPGDPFEVRPGFVVAALLHLDRT